MKPKESPHLSAIDIYRNRKKEKTCPLCGIAFRPRRVDQVFCSPNHRALYSYYSKQKENFQFGIWEDTKAMNEMLANAILIPEVE